MVARIDNWRDKLVSACADGTAVNLGIHHRLIALLQEDMPWVVAIQCLNHRLDLAAKYAYAKTYVGDVSSLLMEMYYAY